MTSELLKAFAKSNSDMCNDFRQKYRTETCSIFYRTCLKFAKRFMNNLPDENEIQNNETVHNKFVKQIDNMSSELSETIGAYKRKREEITTMSDTDINQLLDKYKSPQKRQRCDPMSDSETDLETDVEDDDSDYEDDEDNNDEKKHKYVPIIDKEDYYASPVPNNLHKAELHYCPLSCKKWLHVGSVIGEYVRVNGRTRFKASSVKWLPEFARSHWQRWNRTERGGLPWEKQEVECLKQFIKENNITDRNPDHFKDAVPGRSAAACLRKAYESNLI